MHNRTTAELSDQLPNMSSIPARQFDELNPYASPNILPNGEQYGVGDLVVAIASMPLLDGEKELAAIYPGVQLRVLQIQAEWILVQSGPSGWIEKKYVIPADQAISYFKKAIDREYGNDVLYNALALAYRDQGELELAVLAFSNSILRMPTDPTRWTWRGQTRALRKDFRGALADLDHAVKLDPARVENLNFIAWILATCPDPACRDGRLAIEAAQQALRLTGPEDAAALDTLACAYAEFGDFSHAVHHATEAVKHASETDKPACVQHLQFFQQGIPLRDDWSR